MLDGIEHEVEIQELTTRLYRIKLANAEHDVDICRVGPTSFSVLVCNRSFDLDVIRDGDEVVVASRDGAVRVSLLDPRRQRHRGGTGDHLQVTGPVEVKAMMPGRIVNVLVKEGDQVTSQQGLVVVEAMKMENEIKAPKAGRIVKVRVSPGQTVERGEALITIE
jgi:biotin carboxyl carrier protein